MNDSTLDHRDLEAVLMERLRDEGLRVTPDRLTIFRELSATQHPLPKADLVDRLRAAGINQATVYRVLDLFTALKVVHAVLLPHGVVGYEPVPPFRDHHHHIVCSSCGSLIDLYECDVDTVIKQDLRRIGFLPTSHSLDVIGICAQCQQQSSPP
jgi:Fur family ferric uptake transcriptional regulator